MRIGSYTLRNNLVLAPMAGVTDRPFRQLCKNLGAGMAVSEMVGSNPQLRWTKKTRLRTDHEGEVEPRVVQIAGADPGLMAEAARVNVAEGAQIIDINMGCPAKKVCGKQAGSALLQDEDLVKRILEAVVAAVDVPVTLKIRTGWDPEHRNGLAIGKMAEAAGIQALAVHGRTRADAYRGNAEYDTIRSIKSELGIPVLANGDIASPEKAREVLKTTGADGLLIGRAAQGKPWIFREMQHFLETGRYLSPLSGLLVMEIMLDHLQNLYSFYGGYSGVRIARKHLSWYCKTRDDATILREQLVRVETCKQQMALVRSYFERKIDREELAA